MFRALQQITKNRAPYRTSRYFATFFGNPLDSNPNWVDDRGFIKVCQLHQLSHQFLDSLPHSFTLIDVGCGKGNFLEQVRKKYPRAKLIGATATSIQNENQDAIDEIYYGFLPASRKLFLKLAGKADFVTDTMGVMTYGDNPIHIIIALCSLLKKGGQISSVTLGSRATSRLGDAPTRSLLQQFLADKLSMYLQFHFHQTPLTHPSIIRDTIICRVIANSNGAFIANSLDHYFEMADSIIGLPKAIDNQGCLVPNFPTRGQGSISYDSPDRSPCVRGL